MNYESKITDLTQSLQIMEDKTKEMSEEYTKKEQEMSKEFNQTITKLKDKISQLQEKIILLNEQKEKLLADVGSAKTRGETKEVELQDQISILENSDKEKHAPIQQQNKPKQEAITNETNKNTPEKTKELEKIINEKRSNEAMKIIEKLGGIKALAKNTNLNNMSWSYNPQEDGLFEVITFCDDKSCSFTVVYNSQEMNKEETQPYCQITNNHLDVFYLSPGTYEIFAYNDQSLENIGYLKITIN
ncbi:hypothetical protein ENU1_007380 [Entamoeba nuttalli P19]|uniref:GOLD domain-containing protein n=2 Tax=Entamoeba nuttalli TaxID=412467 RepID=K2H5H3_ENTNP|nr:hypothetical protein ENU1_007380 [Entamoeba nuttalli P19]EKE42863.1 hypothetical protein ENU1_007380 [Entamoeba nuttalli P19]|eukprot:XP_008854798.1 hypothetical protein ENU1_007380 [Entamoeba nuttalli P19]